MDKIIPHISEKSVGKAKKRQFTILVNHSANKNRIKFLVKKYFKLDAVKINIINKSSIKKITARKKSTRRGYKKAVVFLKDKQIMPGFEIADDSKKSIEAKK